MSYQSSTYDAVVNAGRLMKEGRANAVKLEGGKNIQDNEAEDVPASDPEQQEENDPQENSQDSETDRE